MEGKTLNRLYSTHGAKKFLGVPVIINGRKALGYFNGDTIISYIYWEEACEKMYDKKLPVYEVDF